MKLLRLFLVLKKVLTLPIHWWYCVKRTDRSRPQLLKLSTTQHNTQRHLSADCEKKKLALVSYTLHQRNTHVANKANIESTKIGWIFNLLIKQWWRVDQIRECDTPGAIKMLYLIWYAARWRSDTTEATPSNTDFSLVEPGHTPFSAFCV